MTTKTPLPESNQEKVHVFDKEYRCDHWDRPNIYDQSALIFTFKDQPIAPTVDQTENAQNEQPTSQPPKENTNGSTRKPIFPDYLPVSLISIKEYKTGKDGNTCILQHSTIQLKKRRRMLYLPLEFGEITMDRLVESGAFINAMSWSDYKKFKMNSDICVIKEYPQPPFKFECANAQLEQPIATVDIHFNIGTYTFTDTFVILPKTSSPITGLNFLRNHQAVIDTANATINVPHVEMTLAFTDEMKNCIQKLLRIFTQCNQTLPPHQTTVTAVVITINTNDITRAKQPSPIFDETATIIVARALATAHTKRIKISTANLTDFPYTTRNWLNSKYSSQKIRKKTRPIDAAAPSLLQDPDDTHMYVNELMKSNENEQNDKIFGFGSPFRRTQGTEKNIRP